MNNYDMTSSRTSTEWVVHNVEVVKAGCDTHGEGHKKIVFNMNQNVLEAISRTTARVPG